MKKLISVTMIILYLNLTMYATNSNSIEAVNQAEHATTSLECLENHNTLEIIITPEPVCYGDELDDLAAIGFVAIAVGGIIGLIFLFSGDDEE